jgi:hypothetical protein
MTKDSDTGDILQWLEGKKKTKDQPEAQPPSPGGQAIDDAVDRFLQGSTGPFSPASGKKDEEGVNSVSTPGAESTESLVPGAAESSHPPPAAADPDAPLRHADESQSRQQRSHGPAPALDRDPKLINENLLPKQIVAHFILIDIGGEVKKAREIPRYLPIYRLRTLAGRYVSAHIHLDDPATVQSKHAKIIYEEKGTKRSFTIYPIDQAAVAVNGKPLLMKGAVLASGDVVTIGSAQMIFFQKTLKDIDP